MQPDGYFIRMQLEEHGEVVTLDYPNVEEGEPPLDDFISRELIMSIAGSGWPRGLGVVWPLTAVRVPYGI